MNRDTNENWSDGELVAAIEAYLRMLDLQKRDAPFNKAEINRELRAKGSPLAKRSRPALEYRMRNISAVFESLGKPTVRGYAPARNVGDNVREKILRLLKMVE